MGIKQIFFWLLTFIIAQSLWAKEIVLGVELIPQKTMAILFTPIVIPNILSVKAAYEYRLHRKINLVIPLEAQWMNYSNLIKWATKDIAAGKDFPRDWNSRAHQWRIRWNFDYSHAKLSTGFGAKYFPFGESMASAFFVKSIFLVGVERFNAFSAEGIRGGAVLGGALTLGYTWFIANAFACGLEIGGEYDYHTNPIKEFPVFWHGFSPLFQISVGFTI